MKVKSGGLIGLLGLVVLPVFAHEGVKDPAVLARMHAMKEIGAATETLGKMAKGEAAFDAAAAGRALSLISAEAGRTPELFAGAEDDPKSEALRSIWDDFGDFESLALDLETVAAGHAGTLSQAGDLQNALRDVGAACKACHEKYRKP